MFTHRFALIFIAIVLLTTAIAFAAPEAAPDTSFKTAPNVSFKASFEFTVPTTPDSAFDAMTGEIGMWWDHSFSEHPYALYIEPKPGGGFYEMFDSLGNGAKHASVILSNRGKQLTLDGPFGLSGLAITMVASFRFSPVVDGTKIKVTVNNTGQLEPGKEEVIVTVWRHFMIEQYQPFIQSGKFRDKYKK